MNCTDEMELVGSRQPWPDEEDVDEDEEDVDEQARPSDQPSTVGGA